MAEQQNTREGQRTIFISVDGSSHSERAFNFYLSNVYKSGDHVFIFHAMELQTMPAVDHSPGITSYDLWLDSVKTVENEAKALLRHFGDILKTKPDIKVKLIKQTGSPGELICQIIKKEECSLVVLGSRGLGTVRRTFLGSVSDYVVHHSHIPVLIVPSEKPDQ